MKPIRCLAVLLFHDDEDLVEDQIEYYKYKNHHDLIVFNHNSKDNTTKIINEHMDDFVCVYELSENIIFKKNEVHETIYKILMNNPKIKKDEIKMSNEKGYDIDFKKEYDWISFPESDEFLEGPDRTKTYYEHLCDMRHSTINKIIFDNIIYWFSENDDKSILSPVKRMKYYCYKKNCGIRLYAWRADKTIIREFGHMDKRDKRYVQWKTRHYEIRSLEQFYKKVNDRLHISDGKLNHHYKTMYNNLHNKEGYGIIKPEELHYDDGISEINMDEKFDWSKIY